MNTKTLYSKDGSSGLTTAFAGDASINVGLLELQPFEVTTVKSGNDLEVKFQAQMVPSGVWVDIITRRLDVGESLVHTFTGSGTFAVVVERNFRLHAIRPVCRATGGPAAGDAVTVKALIDGMT